MVSHTISLLLILLTAGCCAASFHFEDVDGHVAEFVNRYKRKAPDRVHGHSMAVLHAEDPNSGRMHTLTKRDILAHTSHPSLASRQFAMELQSGDRVNMDLVKRSVVTSGTKIVERLAKNVEVHHAAPRDCFFSGTVENSSGYASLSLCGGKPMGSVHTFERLYEIHSLPPEVTERQRRSTDLVHVLVTWTDVEDSSHSDWDQGQSRYRRSAEEELTDDLVEEVDEEEDEPNEEKSPRSGYVPPPARDVSEKNVIVEVGAFMDTFYQERIGNVYGIHPDTQWYIQLAILKFSGAWAVLSDPKLGWNITLRLVHLEIWKQNPDWYDTTPDASLGARMHSICQGNINKTYDYDQVTLWSDNAHHGTAGLAILGGACSPGGRCTCVMNAHTSFNIEVHEFSHSLGLGHEVGMRECCVLPGEPVTNDLDPATCTKPDRNGFEGGGGPYAPACYGRVFDRTLPRHGCLFWEYNNVTSDEDIQLMTPAQKLGFDGQCQFMFGEDFVYLPTSNPLCTHFYCMVSNRSKASYGAIRAGGGLQGNPCGHGQVCLNRECLPVNETSYPEAFRRNTIVDGGWGPWSRSSGCDDPQSANSGAAAIWVDVRQCNQPHPLHGIFCEGDNQRAGLCPSTPTNVSTHVPDIEALAAQVCSYQRDHGSSDEESASFTGQGGLAGRSGEVETCTVRCGILHQRPSASMYMLPNGIPCTESSHLFEDDVSNTTRYCVHGKCMAFGCDGNSLVENEGKKNDICGVCGGTGDSCVHGQFKGPFNMHERHTLVILPVGATNIYVGHPFSKQYDVNIEMWTKDVLNEQAVLSNQRDVAYQSASAGSPVAFAGTLWHLNSDLQTLTAAGPLDQPVNITVYKEFDLKGFHRAVYRYTPGPGGTNATATCQNGGTPLAGGCSCAQGNYGLQCEHTCSKLCMHGATLDPENCQCNCSAHSVNDDCSICLDGWVLYRGACYKFFDEVQTFFDARKRCEAYNATLSSMKDAAEETFVTSLRPPFWTIWLGLTDIANEGTFVWEDGTPPTWTNWNGDEPNGWGNGEDCTEVKPHSGIHSWNDVSCNARLGFVCKRLQCEHTCSKLCMHGATLDPENCQCNCPVNCDNDDCSMDCVDRNSDCSADQCRDSVYNDSCRRTCSVCQYDSSINNGRCAVNDHLIG